MGKVDVHKEIRRDVRKMQMQLAGELKTWCVELPFLQRLLLVIKIMLKRKDW